MRRPTVRLPIPAVSGIVFQGEAVLLVQRKVAPYRGLWSLPGGAIEGGETMHAAVEREVREETGLEVQPLALVGAYDSIVEEEGTIQFHYVLVGWLCRHVGGELHPGSDADDARWTPLDSLEGVELTPLAGQAIREALRLREDRARDAQA